MAIIFCLAKVCQRDKSMCMTRHVSRNANPHYSVSLGQVVIGGDSRSECCRLESLHGKLD